MAKKATLKKGSPQVEVKKGRPPVAVKKERFQLMLDPRYLAHFKKVAKANNIQPQDLGRMALAAMVPDPFNPSSLGNAKNLQEILGKGSK
jgi:hypothetical protein